MFELGTISHGTMRPEDIAAALVTRFADIMTPQDKVDSEYIAGLDDVPKDWDESELQYANDCKENWPELLESITDTVESHESFPAYCYMGSHEGDGSDLGIWIDWDSLESDAYDGDVLRISDLADLDSFDRVEVSGASYALLVNDHGNASLYPLRLATGPAVWESV